MCLRGATWGSDAVWSEVVGRSVGSVGSEEIQVQRSVLGIGSSHLFRWRSQLDDLVFRGLADDVCFGKKVKLI